MNLISYIQLPPINKRLLASCILSFLWVSNYQYHYNIEIFNSRIINICAFSLWILSGYTYLYLHDKIKNKIPDYRLQITASWVVYFTGLLVVEYTGYNILGIHENSARGGALIFGLIHGNTFLHIYYMLFPALILVVYQLTLMVPAKTVKLFQTLRRTERRFTTWP